MKFAWVKYFSIIFGVFLFIGCNNHKGNTTDKNMDTDPVFSENPRIKGITGQINKSPNDASLYFERGGMLRKLKLDTLALRDYKKAAADTIIANIEGVFADLEKAKDTTHLSHYVRAVKCEVGALKGFLHHATMHKAEPMKAAEASPMMDAAKPAEAPKAAA